MSVNNLDGFCRIVAAATIPVGVLVKPDGTLCAVSTTKTHAGVSNEAAVSGQLVTLINPSGKIVRVQASVAIAVGAAVYYAAAGQIGITSASNTQLGSALEAASGAGSIIAVAFN